MKFKDLKISFFRHLFFTMLILITIFFASDDAGRAMFLTEPLTVIVLASLGSLTVCFTLLLYDLSEFVKPRRD